MQEPEDNTSLEELKEMNIPFKYFEMVDFSSLNELYNLLDLYIVSSRFEGGPQAIMECSLLKIPIISTDVGIAKEILSQNRFILLLQYLRELQILIMHLRK